MESDNRRVEKAASFDREARNRPEDAHFSCALTALAKGDRSAFSAVYKGIVSTVRTICARYLVRSPDREDVVQQVLLKIYVRASEFDPCHGEARSWAAAITLSEIRTARRQTYRRREVSAEDLLQEPSAPAMYSPEAMVIARQSQRAVAELLKAFSPEDERLLMLVASGRVGSAISPRERKRLERARIRLRRAHTRRFSG